MRDATSTTTDLQRQARALGDPTRHAVFRYVADAAGPVGVAELTAHFGLNHNAIRQHLAKLVDAALVEEGTAPPAGRGRPRLTYRLSPGADSRWSVVGPYERLSVLLAEMVRTGDAPVEVGRRAGRDAAPHGGAGDPVAALTEVMDRHGFDPALTETGAEMELSLETCPFASAAVADPEIICSLHLGIAEGVAEATGHRLVVDELEPHDPRQAGCRLRFRVQSSGE